MWKSAFYFELIQNRKCFSDQNRPPSITETGIREVYFKEGEKIKLSCVANGVPKPQYVIYYIYI